MGEEPTSDELLLAVEVSFHKTDARRSILVEVRKRLAALESELAAVPEGPRAGGRLIMALRAELAEARATAKAHPLCKEGYVTKLRAEVERLREAAKATLAKEDSDG